MPDTNPDGPAVPSIPLSAQVVFPDLARLSDFFDPDDLEWKPGATTRDKKKGLAMCYVTARAIQDRLDQVAGPGGWRNEFQRWGSKGVLCGLSILVHYADGSSAWVTKWNGADESDIESTKGGLSNAEKRVASEWGIGRYLYSLPATWTPLDERGRFAETPRVPPAFLPPSARPQAPRSERPQARRSERPQDGRKTSGPSQGPAKRPARDTASPSAPSGPARPPAPPPVQDGDGESHLDPLKEALRSNSWTKGALAAMLADQFLADSLSELTPTQVPKAIAVAQDPALRDRFVLSARTANGRAPRTQAPA